MNPTSYSDLNDVPTDESLTVSTEPVSNEAGEETAIEGIVETVDTGPTGPDFTKPLRINGAKYPARVLTVNASNKNFPVVGLVEIAGVEVAMNFNLMGEDPSLDYVLENVPPLPAIVFGRILRRHTDDGLFFDVNTYATEEEAKTADPGQSTLITTFAQVLTNIDSRESEEPDEPQDGPSEIYVSKLRRSVHIGDTLNAYRRGFGTRKVTVIKLREDATKSVYVQVDDGSTPYWALNKNLS